MSDTGMVMTSSFRSAAAAPGIWGACSLLDCVVLIVDLRVPISCPLMGGPAKDARSTRKRPSDLGIGFPRYLGLIDPTSQVLLNALDLGSKRVRAQVTKMAKTIDADRRRFLGSVALTMAGT